MPEYLKDEKGETKWSQIFMGAAVAIVFVMQQYHAMEISDIKQEVVPRSEFEERHSKTMDREDILAAINLLSERMAALETEKDR